MFHAMRQGHAKHEALVISLRLNMQPVFLTSLTTAIGFLSMNFSDSPPFQHLGNITASGVMMAFVLSVLFLPALMAILPVRVKPRTTRLSTWLTRYADAVVARHRMILWISIPLMLVVMLFIPRNELNDQYIEYFDKSTAFRQDTDFVLKHLTGIYQLEYGLNADESSGVSNPDYLANLEAFVTWFRAQPKVVHVNTVSDILKRLNMNLHGDDRAWYRLPDERLLAAQYLLLYEMSLPYGLDLNNQINIDKSGARVVVTLNDLTTREFIETTERAEAWLREHAPTSMATRGSSVALMFAHLAMRNIRSMLIGTTLALVLISALLILALRSVKLGLLSLLPNLAPAALTFGIWGLTVGQVNLVASVIIGMTLGIVVDDTVHFASKYLRARRIDLLSPEAAIRFAFSSVGAVLITTSIILIIGFMILTLSSFAINAGMGQLSALTIALALLTDFTAFPALLLLCDRQSRSQPIEPREAAP